MEQEGDGGEDEDEDGGGADWKEKEEDIAVTALWWKHPNDVRFHGSPPGPVGYSQVVDNSLTRTRDVSRTSRPRRTPGRGPGCR